MRNCSSSLFFQKPTILGSMGTQFPKQPLNNRMCGEETSQSKQLKSHAMSSILSLFPKHIALDSGRTKSLETLPMCSAVLQGGIKNAYGAF
jgi:hypothetical protein